MTMAEYLKSSRTTTQAEVDRVANTHRLDHITVTERKAYTEGSK